MSAQPIRLAVFSSLYPNSSQPRHGVFVEERLRNLVASGEVEARIIAPVPWFFSKSPCFGRYARFATVPEREQRYGLQVHHPRYPVIPKVGMTLGPAAMARAARGAFASLRADGFDFDLIDAHYFYPDGVAAARLAAYFGRPFTVTSRGSDINVIAELTVPRRQILQAAREAAALVTVSRALGERLQTIGVDAGKIKTLRNGVDMKRFAPRDRAGARSRLCVDGLVWLCVGHLIETKGMHIAIEALSTVRQVTLVIAGDGPDMDALRSQARRLGVADRVRFVGNVGHIELADYYNAADALIFPTYAEGMPNVVLEALACGCAVIATAVGGIPEIMTGPPAGRLLRDRTAGAVIEAWQSLLPDEISETARLERRRHAEHFGWDSTTQGQIQLFRQILDRRAA